MFLIPYSGDFGCPWFCAGSYGPSTPFATPTLMVADSVRIFCMVIGLLIIAHMPKAVGTADSRDQRFRIYGIAAFVVVAVMTEAEHFGDTPSYRLMLNLLGCVTTTYGLIVRDRKIHSRDARRVARVYDS